MTTFEMIKYHSQDYPADVPLRIEEIAAHFDVRKVSGILGWSLHTEYSYGKRNFYSSLISSFPEILSAQRDGVPLLWMSEAWTSQFANFAISLVKTSLSLKVIEIHPPFNDYTVMNGFIAAYAVFESKIKEHFQKVEILIENRSGSVYHGGKFVVSKVKDIAALCDGIDHVGLSLKIAYDVPQIYTAHNASTQKAYLELLEETKTFRSFIKGVHLWGKRLSDTGRKVSHCGDLTSYFGNDAVKADFLRAFSECFDDGVVRKMVLEVNSGNEDLRSIIADLQSADVRFV